MKKLLVANWKENPESAIEAEKLFTAYAKLRPGKKAAVVVCPPFTYFSMAPKTRNFTLGAQDAFWASKGAFTGEVSALMERQQGVKYVILGHSERRMNLGETDAMIAKKVGAAIEAKVEPILCVGEPKAVRAKGIPAAKKYVEKQLIKDLSKLSAGDKLTIAYEPIWAISTSPGAQVDEPEDAAEMMQFIRVHCKKRGMKVRVLYGGSVNAKNAKGFLGRREIDGALVGGASLDPKEFKKIIG